MIDTARYAVSAGALSPILLPVRGEMRVTAYTAGVARLYGSTSPLQLINADSADGSLTPANLAARTGTLSAWLEVPFPASVMLRGYTAAVVVAESGAATVETTQSIDQQTARSGLGAEVSISTQPISGWSHGDAAALPFVALSVGNVSISSAESRDIQSTMWLDWTSGYSVGGGSYDMISATVTEVQASGLDAVMLASFSSSEYALKIDRRGANGLIAESTLLAVLTSSSGQRMVQTDQLRIVPIEFQISRQPLRINF